VASEGGPVAETRPSADRAIVHSTLPTATTRDPAESASQVPVYVPEPKVLRIRAPSARVLGARLRRLRPRVDRLAYVLVVGEDKPETYVVGARRMNQLLEQASQRGFRGCAPAG
jgi:hypothetical protein